MDQRITLAVAPESNAMDWAANLPGALEPPTEGLLSSLNRSVLGDLDAITAVMLEPPTEGLLSSLNRSVLGDLDAITAVMLEPPTEGLLSSLNRSVLGDLDAITAAVLEPPTEGLLSSLNRSVLGDLDAITAVMLEPPTEGLLSSLNRSVLGDLDAITAAVLEPPGGLDRRTLWAIPEVADVHHERRLTTQIPQLPERGSNVGNVQNLLGSFDKQITSAGLVQCTRALFADGHYSVAVEKAFVYLENLVKQKSGLSGKHGSSLMKTVFSAQNPLIRLNAWVTDSDRDEQLGYMEIFAGVMTGIRNPRAHSHNWVDKPEEALELLVLANHLAKKILMGSSSRNSN